MDCPYRTFSICEVCVLKIHLKFHKMLDSVGWRSLYESYMNIWSGVCCHGGKCTSKFFVHVWFEVAYGAIMLGESGRYCRPLWCLVSYEVVGGD